MSAIPTLATGIFTGLSLIVAIGAQNAFVLRQGLLRHHVGIVVAFCAASDFVLIIAAVAGLGVLLDAVPEILEVLRWSGVAFLGWYAVLAARRAIRPGRLDPASAGVGGSPGSSARTVLATSAALTWLNPHVYLDVVMLAALASSRGELRWWFTAGLIAASILWFVVLGFGAGYAGRLLAQPSTWRILDASIAVVMATIAARLTLNPLEL